MPHVNTQVRDVVETRLKEIKDFEDVDQNVGSNIEAQWLPAARILTPNDTVEAVTKTKGTEPMDRRTIELNVVLVVSGAEAGLDTDLDALRVKVEGKLAQDDNLGGIAKRVTHTGAELDIGTDEDGEEWMAFLLLTWEVEVWTARGNPEVAL